MENRATVVPGVLSLSPMLPKLGTTPNLGQGAALLLAMKRRGEDMRGVAETRARTGGRQRIVFHNSYIKKSRNYSEMVVKS